MNTANRLPFKCGIVVKECKRIFLMGNKAGYTLYLVMVILSVSALLFSVTLFGIRSAVTGAKREINQTQADFMAKSGVVRASFFLNGDDGHSIDWETPEYIETVDRYGTITLSLKRFGLFKRVVSTGKRLRESCTISKLYGRTIPLQLHPALTITGHIGGLILHKGSWVDGNLVLHHGYVYPKKGGVPISAYTRRLTFKESSSLPFDSTLLPRLCNDMAHNLNTLGRSKKALSGPFTLDAANDSLFAAGPLVVRGDCNVNVLNGEVYVTGCCTILQNAVVENGAIYAKKLVVEGGHTNEALFFSKEGIAVQGGVHNSQFISTDSITVRARVRCGAKSIFAVLRSGKTIDSQTVVSGGIYIEPDAKIAGTVISAADLLVNRSVISPSIVLGKGCKVSGMVITDGDCWIHNATIEGHLWTRAIVAQDSSGSYTNYLIGSTITGAKQRHVFPLVGKEPFEIVTD